MSTNKGKLKPIKVKVEFEFDVDSVRGYFPDFIPMEIMYKKLVNNIKKGIQTSTIGKQEPKIKIELPYGISNKE